MAFRQVIKYKRRSVPSVVHETEIPVITTEKAKPSSEKKNNRKKTEDTMEEKINKAEEIMNNLKDANHVKVIKKDKGLIERTESSKIVLTEDNRQVLND